MEELKTNEELNINDIPENVDTKNTENTDKAVSEITPNTKEMIEYQEVEEPCVALTIIGENKLTDTEVFVRRGIKYTIKAFFSAIVLTIMNLFI